MAQSSVCSDFAEGSPCHPLSAVFPLETRAESALPLKGDAYTEALVPTDSSISLNAECDE